MVNKSKYKEENDDKMEVDGCGSSEEEDQKVLDDLNKQENRKHKKSGGFQSMGLSGPVFKGIFCKGFKLPTPIQRKTIPVILDGRDVVAMARTGSGKTGAFIIPMLEKLKAHDPTGVRAIILSPTRELAMQTHKFAKEIGKFVKLRYATILGGDKIENQFAAIHGNPDVIIATPGRLMHILTEMNLKLNNVKYIVFDEADRLFELNFQEQLGQILARIPESRQTLLFSATLPKMLVEFAAAGLSSPELIRLDVDTKLSDQLSMFFLECRSDNKMAVLLHLMKNVITPAQPTFIFVATKHHVEYVNMVLKKAGFSCSISYSSLDQTARSINVDKFKNKRTNVFIVTDLAARGIDIPILDNVINFNFPAKPKLFLHRVGRVARAGRTGSAYSIVSLEEKPYVLDLYMFLGRPMKFASESYEENKNETDLYGLVPQVIIDEEEEKLKEWHKTSDISPMVTVIANAYKHYVRTRPAASTMSIKRVKSMSNDKMGYHPVFGPQVCCIAKETEDFMSQLKNYKPEKLKMKNVTGVHFQMITKHVTPKSEVPDATEPPAKVRKVVKCEEFYLNYTSKDLDTEKGLSLESGFEKEASKVMLDVVGDEENEMKRHKSRMIWDRKKKKFVKGDDDSTKKGKNEAGAKIKGKPKKELYKTWLHKSKVRYSDGNSDDNDNPRNKPMKRNFAGKHVHNDTRESGNMKGPRPELKKKEQILKAREKKKQVQAFQNKRRKKNQGKKNKYK